MLDIVSHGRQGPRGSLLTAEDRELILRTVIRTPEVMIKISGGGNTAKKVAAHLRYVGRGGQFEIESDEGERFSGTGSWNEIVQHWNLDLDEASSVASRAPTASRRRPPKLVHNIIFSMPPGTPHKRLLAAVRVFAQEQFPDHRYAMALHTDEPHPHVHVIVKAMSEQGQRLNPSPATLREWRSEFARHLREHGVPANATPRRIRGETKPRKLNSIYRAMLRGESTHVAGVLAATAGAGASQHSNADARKAALLQGRRSVKRGWAALARALKEEGVSRLAARALEFMQRMPPARTEEHWLRLEAGERASAMAEREISNHLVR